jgi:hypothetical protein
LGDNDGEDVLESTDWLVRGLETVSEFADNFFVCVLLIGKITLSSEIFEWFKLALINGICSSSELDSAVSRSFSKISAFFSHASFDPIE